MHMLLNVDGANDCYVVWGAGIDGVGSPSCALLFLILLVSLIFERMLQ
jgi:hypothetical protein